MFDVYSMLLDNATSGDALARTWLTQSPVVFCLNVESGTPTVTLKGCDTEDGTYETIGTVTGKAGGGKTYARFLVPYNFIKATSTAACDFGLVPAGEYTDPA